MNTKDLLVKTPEFFKTNVDTTHGAIIVIDILNEVFCAYTEHRIGKTGVVNEDIEISYVTGFQRAVFNIIQESLMGAEGVPNEFPIGYNFDLFFCGPESISQTINIVDDLFDAYLRSDYFQGPSDEFLKLFCDLRKALLALVSNLFTAVFIADQEDKAKLKDEVNRLNTEFTALTAN